MADGCRAAADGCRAAADGRWLMADGCHAMADGDHSYLRHTTGSCRAARHAGTKPKTMPTVMDTPKATNTETNETIVVILAMRSIPKLSMPPTMMPATPPARLMSTASLRNCARMSFWLAPTARRTPI